MANVPNMLLWVTALEEENLPQTNGCLRDREGYCCLGVAVDVAMRNGIVFDVEEPYDGDHDSYTRFSFDGEEAVLPLAVEEWLGLDYSNPLIGSRRDMGLPCPFTDVEDGCGCDTENRPENRARCYDDLEAASANDGERWTFPVIAAAIRKYYDLPTKENT